MDMRTLAFAAVISAILGAGSGILATANAAAASDSKRCSNTWCYPGGTTCVELSGWGCSLDGGCSGTERCE
jgi:hypothetical protein